MKIFRPFLRVLTLLTLSASFSVNAQQFGPRPIKITTPYPAGSGPDVVVRMIADKVSNSIKHPVVVDAKPGANGVLAIDVVRRSPADGNDLLLVDNGHLAINPNLFKKLTYDVDRDLSPVSMIFRTPFYVIVSAQSKINSIPELIGAAKSKPESVSYASPFIGSPSHLGGALMQAQTGTKMLHVPFREASQIWAAVSSGDVTWGLGSYGTTASYLQAGKLKLLAVASKERVPDQPTVLTVEEAGGPKSYEVTAWVSIMAPKGTPTNTINVLNREFGKALRSPEVISRMKAMGFEISPSSPEELAQEIKADTKKYADVVKLSGASVD